jgi:acyl dehydratase
MTGDPRGLVFEEFEPGRSWTSPARTVTTADIDRFADLTGDRNPVHLDAAHASRTPFRGRIAHGLLVESLASGLAWQMGVFDGTIVALAEVSMRFLQPVAPGDELALELTVVEREAEPGPRRGLVVLRTLVSNQRGTVVLDGTWRALVQRAAARARGQPGPGS